MFAGKKKRAVRGFSWYLVSIVFLPFFFTLLFNAQKLVDARLVEANEHVVADVNNRYAHLAAFFNHFLALIKIFSNVVVFKRYTLLLKIVLCHVAEMTGGSAVDSDFLVHNV